MSVEGRPTASRSPWQWLYRSGHRWRRRWYRSRRRALPRPVISVGNLHWGGSGKTPLVASIARHCVEQGRSVAILSRGYGRRDRRVRVVSAGDGPLLGPSVAGDEPVLLAGEVRGAAVVVGADRYAAGRHALERLDPPPELFLLDDAFSHLALARDVDLLVLPAADPFGGSRLWPSGRLREPLESAADADAVLLSGGDAAAAREAANRLRPFGFDGPGFGCERRTLAPRQTGGDDLPAGAPVLLVSGIARPTEFAAAVAREAVDVVGQLVFADHHAYPEATLDQIRAAFDECGARFVVTTAKDRVKLLGRLDRPLAELPLIALPDDAFFQWLDRRLAALEGEGAAT